MSALTDLFTSLANKIRSKLGTTSTYTPAQAIAAIDNVYNKGVTDTKKGNATTGDVKSGKTFTSTNGVELTGTFTAQEKTVTAGTSAASVTPDSGKYLSKVTYNPTPSQTKSASPSTSAQTISPDSGKYLSSVSISAISPQRSTGTAASASGRDSTGPYVYFPYGWWPNYSNSRNYTRLTEAQAISTVATEEKSGGISPNSTTALVVTPSSGKLLSKVSVSVSAHTATKTPSGSSELNNSALNLGEKHNYRYVNTAVCYSQGVKHHQTNRAGFCSGWIKDDGAEYRMDLYDMLAGTTISITTTNSNSAYMSIINIDTGATVAQAAPFKNGRPLTYTFKSTMGILVIIKRTSAYPGLDDFWFWWSVSNSSY